jgi:hypothetical protein
MAASFRSGDEHVAIPLAGVQGLRRLITATTNSCVRSPSLSSLPPYSPPLPPLPPSQCTHVIQVWTRLQYGKDRILCCTTVINLPAIVAEQEGMAQYKFPYPVKGRAQGRSRGPPIPVIWVDIVAVGIVAIRVRPIFVVAIAATAAARQCHSSSLPARRTAPGACLVVSNATVTQTAAQSVADGGPNGNDGSAAIAMQ